MVSILMMPSKIATLGLLKIKIFLNKGYDVIISVYDVNNKNSSWTKCGNSSISMSEVIITSILEGFD